jgi:CheY-like chemotaxis protein
MAKPVLIVVDDEPEIAKIAEFLGGSIGFDVHVASNGKVFRKLLDEHTPFAVILDVFMPEMDGVETVKWLAEEGRNPPLILISGDRDYLDMTKALALSGGLKITETFEKPVSIDKIETVLKQLMD